MSCVECQMAEHDECSTYYCKCPECIEKDLVECYRSTISVGGVKEIAEIKLAEFASSGVGVSIARLGDRPHTITEVVRKDYEEHLGTLVTTKESFEIDGEQVNKFYTTRTYLVEKFYTKDDSGLVTPTALCMAVNQGGELKVKQVSKTSQKSKKEYFVYEQA